MSLVGFLYWLTVAWCVISSLRAGYRAWASRVNNPVRRFAQWLVQALSLGAAGIPLFCFLGLQTLKTREDAQYESFVFSINAGYGKIHRGDDVILARVTERPRRAIRRVVGLSGDPLKESWGRFYRDIPKERVHSLPKGYVAVAQVSAGGAENDIQVVHASLIEGRVWFSARVYTWSLRLSRPPHPRPQARPSSPGASASGGRR